VLALAACTPPADRAAASRIEADTRLLADDAFGGRAADGADYRRAADWVAARFRALGLQPAGDAGGYLQAVPLWRVQALPGATLSIDAEALRDGQDFALLPNPQRALALDSDAVFAGYGVRDALRDDYAGLDVRGRAVVVVDGAPPTTADDLRATRGDLRGKRETLAALGARAIVVLSPPDLPDAAWAQLRALAMQPTLQLRDTQSEPATTRGATQVTHAAALPCVFVRATPRTLAALFGADWNLSTLRTAMQSDTLPRRPLATRVQLRGRQRVDAVTSYNVLAVRAAHASAAPVVVSAHLDHLERASQGADRIYNGALDNALGVAVLLEAARDVAHAPTPARPVLFAAFTAEEHGLLGSRAYVASAQPRPVADLNIDMPMLLTPTRDVVAVGEQHSTLGTSLHRAATALDVDITPDPDPALAAFVRSDHYSFVRAGIPALYLEAGVRARHWGDDAAAARAAFLASRYHTPGDDMSQAIAWNDVVRLARLHARIALDVANAPDAPRWNPRSPYAPRAMPPDAPGR